MLCKLQSYRSDSILNISKEAAASTQSILLCNIMAQKLQDFIQLLSEPLSHLSGVVFHLVDKMPKGICRDTARDSHCICLDYGTPTFSATMQFNSDVNHAY